VKPHADDADLNLSQPPRIAAPRPPHVECGNLLTGLSGTSGRCGALPGSLVFAYRGWHVDASRAAAVQPHDRSIGAICRQIDIVEGVGLSPDILQFMRSVRFWINPLRKGSVGNYARPTGVDFHVRELNPNLPIALHELLHAFHDQCLGFRHPVIHKFYQSALGRNDWLRDAHMLTNGPEFFAMTASALLFRHIPRPPYSAELLKQTQPEYFDWLSILLHHARASWSEGAAQKYGPAYSLVGP